MSVQDKIFDVQAVLENSGDQGAINDFNDLMDIFAHMESTIVRQDNELNAIRDAFAVFKNLLK